MRYLIIILLFIFGCAAAPDPLPVTPIEIDFELKEVRQHNPAVDGKEYPGLILIFEIRHKDKIVGIPEFFIDLSNVKLSDSNTQ